MMRWPDCLCKDLALACVATDRALSLCHVIYWDPTFHAFRDDYNALQRHVRVQYAVRPSRRSLIGSIPVVSAARLKQGTNDGTY